MLKSISKDCIPQVIVTRPIYDEYDDTCRFVSYENRKNISHHQLKNNNLYRMQTIKIGKRLNKEYI